MKGVEGVQLKKFWSRQAHVNQALLCHCNAVETVSIWHRGQQKLTLQGLWNPHARTDSSTNNCTSYLFPRSSSCREVFKTSSSSLGQISVVKSPDVSFTSQAHGCCTWVSKTNGWGFSSGVCTEILINLGNTKSLSLFQQIWCLGMISSSRSTWALTKILQFKLSQSYMQECKTLGDKACCRVSRLSWQEKR